MTDTIARLKTALADRLHQRAYDGRGAPGRLDVDTNIV